jgi:hypothetical protein
LTGAARDLKPGPDRIAGEIHSPASRRRFARANSLQAQTGGDFQTEVVAMIRNLINRLLSTIYEPPSWRASAAETSLPDRPACHERAQR